MITSHLIGAILALIAAAAWGGGDFSGGLAARKNSSYQVLVLSSASGLIALLVLMLATGEELPRVEVVGWSAAAGIVGAFGIAALYRGLVVGDAAVVAPTAGVLGAMLPVVVGILLEGPPRVEKWVGFGLGMAGIWLVSGSAQGGDAKVNPGFGLAIVAGLGFGGFFVLIAQVPTSSVFGPLVLAKLAAIVVALGIVGLKRLRVPSPRENLTALLAGILDAAGNVFYLMASQSTRMDVAVVISSMYPAGTVILASLILKQKVTMAQKTGVALCILAIMFIAA